MSIQIRLAGGMGNQLHQLAAGVAMAGYLNSDLKVDTSAINLGSNASRRYELDRFDWGPLRIETEEIGKPNFFKPFLNKVIRLLPAAFEQLLPTQPSTYAESSEPPEIQLSSIRIGDIVSGHFVSFKWADIAKGYGFAPRVRDEKISVNAREIATTIYDQSLAIHLRFGDYITMPDLFPLITDSFLEKALAIMEGHKQIWIFTDDLSNAEKYCPKIMKNASFAFSQATMSAIDTFWLMTQFPKIITGNSTFSTWAAYLSKVQNPKIVTPTPHLLKGWIDGLPENWIRIPISNAM